MPQLVALQTMVPQFENPADMQAKAYNVRNLALQNQAAEQARADDQAARAAFAANPSDDARRLSALAGVSPAAYGAEAKRQADLSKTGAETRVKELEAAHKANDMRAKAFGYVRQYPTLQNANNAVKWLTENGIYTPEQAAGLYAEIQRNPNNVAQMADEAWYANLDQKEQLLKFEKQDLGGQAQIVSIDPVTGQAKVVSTTAKTQSPDSVASNARIREEGRLDRANRLQVQGMMTSRQNDMPRGQVVQTDDGPVLVNPRTGEATQVTMGGQPVQAKAKSIPASVQKAMTENDSALRKIEDALQAVNEYPEALGGMNVLGDAVRQRTDPKGVKARALVADIGSLKLHDRSGAAVTAAETPRLKPFIPAATDTPDTVRTKLDLFRREYQAIQDDIRSAYPKETSRRAAPATAPAAPAPALPSGWSVEVR